MKEGRKMSIIGPNQQHDIQKGNQKNPGGLFKTMKGEYIVL